MVNIIKRLFILFLLITIIMFSFTVGAKEEQTRFSVDELSPESFLHRTGYFSGLQSIEKFVAVFVSLEGSWQKIADSGGEDP